MNSKNIRRIFILIIGFFSLSLGVQASDDSFSLIEKNRRCRANRSTDIITIEDASIITAIDGTITIQMSVITPNGNTVPGKILKISDPGTVYEFVEVPAIEGGTYKIIITAIVPENVSFTTGEEHLLLRTPFLSSESIKELLLPFFDEVGFTIIGPTTETISLSFTWTKSGGFVIL